MTTRKRAPKVSAVTQDSAGQAARRRREALGLSVRQMEAEAGIGRATISRIENDDPKVEGFTRERLMRALDKLEKRFGTDDPERVLSRVQLPDGTVIVFEGTPDGVAEAVADYLRRRNR